MYLNAYWPLALAMAFWFTGCGKPEGEEMLEEEEPTPVVQTDTLSFLALGDSYTIGASVSYAGRWPVQLAQQANLSLPDSLFLASPSFVARTGWVTTRLLEAIGMADTLQPPYKLVSLLIGVNNQYQNRPIEIFREEYRQLLDTAIAFAGYDTSRVIVLSIPDYAYTPFGQNRPQPAQISAEIDAYNAVKREITASLGVAYFDITPISRQGLAQPELVAADGLHPSEAMYALWVQEVLPYVLSALN